ncbi:RNA polymerase, sigma subunit, ECF family [Sphingobacterium nematocida]|uniref:RNA polymerase, sigma subunit, ECF family n=1 Tax=Sphingobacterium nematocida TaxID=1513896 RepID=A0A1T5AXE0_9SPHI|nr:RNA polymerase sigma factor [Sphingobacterium nematocida]SKB39711.1 RNA polymerase, sigma subunit, ECF family [Sphingobacterium nematocida]
MDSRIPKDEIAEILLRVSNGDEQAYRTIFEAYKTSIYSTVFNLSDDEFMAEEVLQDTFIRLWNYRSKLVEVDNFDAWIYRVAKNVFLTKIKKSTPSQEPLDLILHDIFATPKTYNDIEYRELETAFEQAVQSLSPKQRITYQLVKIEGLSRKEVAKILEVSAETVKWNLDESVKKIRSTMSEMLKNLPLALILFYLQKK